MDSSPRFVSLLFLTAIAAIGLAAPAHGQPGSVAPQPAQIKSLAYDVVSVKPHQTGDGSQSQGPTRSGYVAKNVMIVLLIRDAYNLTKLDQISGLRGWATDARFDLEAKIDEETASALAKLPNDQQQWRQRQLMLQAALADRFKLKVHRESRILPLTNSPDLKLS